MRCHESIIGVEEGEKRLNRPTKLVDIFPIPFKLDNPLADDGVNEDIEEFRRKGSSLGDTMVRLKGRPVVPPCLTH